MHATYELFPVPKFTDDAPDVSPVRVTLMFVLGPLSVLLKLDVVNCKTGGGGVKVNGRQAENSEVLPAGSDARQLIMPLFTPTGKSNGKLNGALPLLSVVTFGIFPETSGRVAAWLVVHCESALKNQCTV